jgi:hypothetical protein
VRQTRRMGFFDDLADGISGLIYDAKIEDGVRGTAQVVAASGYYGHALYQNCHLEVVVEAPGIPATATSVDAVVSRTHWPRPGQTLPALIERANPREAIILWDEIPSTLDVAKAQAETLAAQKRGEAPATTPYGPGATVKIVGDVSQVTPEQRAKLKAMGIDLDVLLGGGSSTGS